MKTILRGHLKCRRVSYVGVNVLPDEFGVGARWGTRYFILTTTSLIQQRDEGDMSHKCQISLGSIALIRWPTAHETKAGFAVTFTNSVRMLLGTVQQAAANVSSAVGSNVNSQSDDKPKHQNTQLRFVIELVGDSSESRPSLMFETETPAEASRWYEAIEQQLDILKQEEGTTGPVVFMKEALKDIREFYDLGPSLGSGMSGVVKRIIRRSDGKAFAKTILVSQLSPKQLAALRNEIDILKILDHPHICKLYETYTEPGVCVRLVLELCEGGELFDRLHARKRFSEQWVAKLVYRMAGVLRYLHENHITHRDLKLENWLFRSKEDDDEIVLIDFGLSHKYRNEEHMHKKVGTSYYVAPEVLKGDYMGVQADMWSLGVIVYMLLGGCAPYDGQDDEEILQNVALARKPNYETGPWKRVSEMAKSFVQGLLTVDPDKRLTAEAALQHPWVVASEKSLPKYDVDDDMYKNLSRFAGFSTLKRIAMEVVAFSLSHDEIKRLTNVFESMDSDHNGYVTFGGLKRELGKNFKISDEELRKIFDALDEEHTGKVHVNEFVAATMQFKYHLDETHLKQAFAMIDKNNTGFITVSDLKAILGKHIDDRRALEMIKAAELEDHGDSHKLSFREFLDFVRKDGETQVDKLVSSTPKSTASKSKN
jgi:calcium-dependent protein kinase